MAEPNQAVWLQTDTLQLDRRNPRLVEFGVTSTTPEKEIIEILWETMDVQELVQSIAASGYFAHEPLIIVKENSANIVIEGNRRLAAVRVLLDDDLANNVKCKVRISDKTRKYALTRLPVVISDRASSWQYLGFKHVNGPARWSSYAKAQYIAEVHREHSISLARIADQIGDRHKTVQRLYRGLMIIEQAEEAKLFNKEDTYRSRFAFSHLYTGLDYTNIAAFLSLSSANLENPRPVPREALAHLGELLLWMYGSRRQRQPPVIQRQNPDLRTLDFVLGNTEALEALRDGESLTSAQEIARDPSEVLQTSLLRAKRELTRAVSHLVIGFDESESLLRIAGDVADLADDIHDQMQRMTRSSSRTKRRDDKERS